MGHITDSKQGQTDTTTEREMEANQQTGNKVMSRTDSMERQMAQLVRGRNRRQMEGEEEREKMKDKGLRCGDRPTVDTRAPGRPIEQVPKVRPSHESRHLERALGRLRTKRKAGSDAPEEAPWVWT